MFKNKYLIFIIVILVVLVLVVLFIYYITSWDYLIYTIKTFNQDKYKLTVNVKDERTNNPWGDVLIEIVQITDSEEKKVVSKRSNKDGVIVFYLLPGNYKGRGVGNFWGRTGIITLNKNKEVDLKIWIPVMQ